MTKRKAKKQRLEKIARLRHKIDVQDANNQRRVEEWMTKIIVHPVIPPGIARWLKP